MDTKKQKKPKIKPTPEVLYNDLQFTLTLARDGAFVGLTTTQIIANILDEWDRKYDFGT